jgi:hypothetical protein
MVTGCSTTDTQCHGRTRCSGTVVVVEQTLGPGLYRPRCARLVHPIPVTAGRQIADDVSNCYHHPAATLPQWSAVAEHLNEPVGAVDANLLAIANQARGVLDADDGRQAVLTGDHGAVRHEAADLGDESTDRHEQR